MAAKWGARIFAQHSSGYGKPQSVAYFSAALKRVSPCTLHSLLHPPPPPFPFCLAAVKSILAQLFSLIFSAFFQFFFYGFSFIFIGFAFIAVFCVQFLLKINVLLFNRTIYSQFLN